MRLSDELDEDSRRGDPLVAEKIGLLDSSEFYWRFNQRIRGISPNHLTKEIDVNIKFKPTDLETEYKEDGKTISFIHKFFKKIYKINSERTYCNRFLPDTLQFSSLRLSIKPIEGQNSWMRPRNISVDDQLALEEIIVQLPRELTRPYKPGAGQSVSTLIERGHKYFSSLPNPLENPPTVPRLLAEALTHEFRVKVEALWVYENTLSIWLRNSNWSILEVKSVILGIACLCCRLQNIKTIEVGICDTRDLFRTYGQKTIVQMKMCFDVSIIEQLAVKQEANDALWKTKVYFIDGENTPHMIHMDVSFEDLK